MYEIKKKNNDIERNSTKFYQKQTKYQRQNVASLVYFVLYIQVYTRQVVIYTKKVPIEIS